MIYSARPAFYFRSAFRSAFRVPAFTGTPHGYIPENGSLLTHEAERQAESLKALMRFIDLNLDNNASHESQFSDNDIHDPGCQG